jgi:hypothetical protein
MNTTIQVDKNYFDKLIKQARRYSFIRAWARITDTDLEKLKHLLGCEKDLDEYIDYRLKNLHPNESQIEIPGLEELEKK